MKKLVITSTLALLTASWSMLGAQEYPAEYLGLPGDNLNLYATMKLFQESETLESFEKKLNEENSRINNLDLNGDNQVDYIMVIDYVDGDTHSIVLRAALNRDETQDVAVFTVQRLRDGSVQVQLVGDEELYGKNYIIEPIYADNDETPNPGYIGNSGNVAVVRTTTYEVAAWPVVRFIYLPSYISWHSSWYWGYYPSYWNPWHPFYWHTYYGYHYNWHNHYYRHYRSWNHIRCNNYNNFYYTNIRTHSSNVRARINNGNYRNTYSRPDLRKDGEALYTRTNSGQNARSRDNFSTDDRRGNTSKTSQNRSIESTRSGVERSSVTNETRRTKDSSVTRRTESPRKSSTVAGSRNIEKNSSVKQKTGNASKSSAKVSSRNVSKTPETPRSVSSGRTSGQSQSKSAVSSRNSSSQSRSAVSSGNSGSSSRSSGSRSSSGSSSSRSSGRR